MKFLARHDSLIAIIGTGVLTIAYYWGVIAPGRGAADQLRSEIAQAEEKIQRIPMLLAERSQLQKKLDSERERIVQVETAVPGNSHVSDVLHKIASQAREAGLNLARLEPLAPIEYASYTAYPFHLNCRGSFADTIQFLKGLETQPRLLTFGNVNFTKSADGSSPETANLTIQSNIDFSVYSRHANSTRLAENTISSRP